MCLQEGRVERAVIADHVIPHRGDVNMFWLGSLQSLCVTHHSKTKQQIENKGYSRDIGADGFPSDPEHPFNVVSKGSS